MVKQETGGAVSLSLSLSVYVCIYTERVNQLLCLHGNKTS